MSKLTRQCTALTKKGHRCANKGKKEFSGLCGRHHNESKLSKGKAFDKVGKVAKVGGGIISAAGGIIKIVEYVTTHWDSIKHLIGLSHNWYFYLHQEYTIKQEAERIYEIGKAVLENEYHSEAVEIELRREFSNWFKNLPDDVKRKVQGHFGERMVREILHYN